jgi:hypothetical protein
VQLRCILGSMHMPLVLGVKVQGRLTKFPVFFQVVKHTEWDQKTNLNDQFKLQKHIWTKLTIYSGLVILILKVSTEESQRLVHTRSRITIDPKECHISGAKLLNISLFWKSYKKNITYQICWHHKCCAMLTTQHAYTIVQTSTITESISYRMNNLQRNEFTSLAT